MKPYSLQTLREEAIAAQEELKALLAEIERLRARLKQIVCVCDDNKDAKHIENAIDFIRQLASQ